MSQHNGAGRAYEWDEGPIQNPNEGSDFVLLPVGEYPFRVLKFERGQFPGSNNGSTPACKKAILTLELDGGPLGKTTAKDDLILFSTFEWKLCQFFKAIGDRKSGEPLRMNWGAVIGKRGRCKIRHRPGKQEGVIFIEVDSYLDPGAAPSPVPAPQQQPAMAGAVSRGWDDEPTDDIPF